ncbi:MAG: MerR family transcriptional regulator [Pirellulaceae bacterium]
MAKFLQRFRRYEYWWTVRELLTPKQVARAIRVSESSVKRWCDKGIIPTQYTAGGHRRIPVTGLLEFLRTSKFELVDMPIPGLHAACGAAERMWESSAEQLAQALLQGDEQECRRIVLDLYFSDHRVSVLCDEVVAKAFHLIGHSWACGDTDVYQERRGCELTLRVLHELRALVLPPPADAPLAIGAAPAGDQYALATTSVELVLQDVKWSAKSLGVDLPFETLHAAIRRHQPRLFWLSCSHLTNENEFLVRYARLHDEFGQEVAFVVGGQALNASVRQHMKFTSYCENMRQLESFAMQLLGTLVRRPPQLA